MANSSLWILTDVTPVLAKQASAGGMHFAYPKGPFVKGLGSEER